MKKLIVLILVLVAIPITVWIASSATRAPKPELSSIQDKDEAAELFDACGKPSNDQKYVNTDAGRDGTQRIVKYPAVEFQFMRNSEDNPKWTLIGAFHIHGNDAMAATEVARFMPCIAKVHFSNDLFQNSSDQPF